MELAGEIESVGRGVRKFKPGDLVFGTTGFEFGAYAEYRCLPEKTPAIKKGMIATKPSNMSYREAAAGVTTGGMTALMFLKAAQVHTGQKILIYGASGSVGSYAVQLAKYFGAHVTGVCSTANLETVRSLGADEVIDYTKEELGGSGETYDIFFDTVDKLPVSRGKALLTKTGVYLNVVRSSGEGDAATYEDLLLLKKLVEEGKLKAVIDRYYPLEEIVEAHRYVEKGHKRGHVVIDVINDTNDAGAT